MAESVDVETIKPQTVYAILPNYRLEPRNFGEINFIRDSAVVVVPKEIRYYPALNETDMHRTTIERINEWHGAGRSVVRTEVFTHNASALIVKIPSHTVGKNE